MSQPVPAVLQILAMRNKRAVRVADAIVRLVTEGAELGELTEVTVIGHDRQPRTVRLPPREWFDRLAVAAERGAFERMTVKAVVARILDLPEAR